MKHYFCELFKTKIKELESSFEPTIQISIPLIKQSYNRQQHTIHVQAELAYKFNMPVGHNIHSAFDKILYKTFHCVAFRGMIYQDGSMCVGISQFYYLPFITKFDKGADIDQYTKGFYHTKRVLIKHHYIEDIATKNCLLNNASEE